MVGGGGVGGGGGGEVEQEEKQEVKVDGRRSLQLCQRRRQRHVGTAADAVQQCIANAFALSLHIQPLLSCRMLDDCHLHGLAVTLQLFNLSSQPLFISNMQRLLTSKRLRRSLLSVSKLLMLAVKVVR